MMTGEPAPEWAPESGEIITVHKWKDGFDRINECDPPEKFCVFMADFFPKKGVRFMGRSLAEMDDPIPGVAAFFIENPDWFTSTGEIWKKQTDSADKENGPR